MILIDKHLIMLKKIFYPSKSQLILFTCLNMLIFVFCLLILGTYLRLDVEKLQNQYPIRSNQKNEIQFITKRPVNWRRLNQISPFAQKAIIISEDWAFYDHLGLDVNQLTIVIEKSWESKSLGRGASTITQQVIKNVFLSSERSILRKLKEMILAIKLERSLSKNKILEIYLNIVEFGPNIYGIESAAQYYFSKSAIDLTLMESAFLAMLLPSPIRYGESFKQKLNIIYDENKNEVIRINKYAK